MRNSQLVAAKVSKLEFRGKEEKFPRHFMCEFDPSQVSHPFMRSARLPKRRENGPEIPAFRSFGFISGLQFAEPEVEIAESLRPCPQIFPFCGDYRWRPVCSLLPPDRIGSSDPLLRQFTGGRWIASPPKSLEERLGLSKS